jgi:predicted DNA binding CopG/RHH family protein
MPTRRFNACAMQPVPQQSKDKRVNIRLSSADLLDIQARALAEGMPSSPG